MLAVIECQCSIEIFFRVETAQTGTNHAIRFIVSIRSVHASEIRQTLFGSTVIIRLKRNQTIVELAQGIPKLFRVALVCNHKDLVPCHTGQLVLQPDRQYVPSRFIRHRGLADAEPGVGTLHMNGEPLIR